MRPSLIVSSCGTSILTGQATPTLRALLTTHANAATPDAVPDDDRTALTVWLDERRDRLRGEPELGLWRTLSAELNTLSALLGPALPWPVHHLLVHTDTWLGRVAAEILQTCLLTAGGSVELLSGDGLRTSRLLEFRLGVSDLVEKLEARVPAYQRLGPVVFSLSGGFKSLNGFLQGYGLVRADSCVYLFEGAPELVRIPRLPVTLELERIDDSWAPAFRRIEANYPVAPAEMAGVPETLWTELDGVVGLSSPWGDMAWSAARRGVLGRIGLPPLSPKLTVAPAALEALRRSQPEEVESANRSLDTLAAYLDGFRSSMPASRAFKPFHEKRGVTHELYAWSGRSAGRFFGALSGGRFHVASLEAHPK